MANTIDYSMLLGIIHGKNDWDVRSKKLKTKKCKSKLGAALFGKGGEPFPKNTDFTDSV